MIFFKIKDEKVNPVDLSKFLHERKMKIPISSNL